MKRKRSEFRFQAAATPIVGKKARSEPSGIDVTQAGEVEPRDLSAALIGSLALLLVTVAAVTWQADSAGSSGAMPLDRIDPNTAPWYELTTLPDIGERAARAIVEYRERIRRERVDDEAIVFPQAADLDAVQGIGPVTIGRIAPYLRFSAFAPPTSDDERSGAAALNTRSRSSGERH